MRPTTPPALVDLDPAALADPDVRAAFDGWTDAELVDAVATVVAVPRATEPDSFVLHAPLELLARTALLPLVAPTARPLARARLLHLASTYAHAAPGVALTDVEPTADPGALLAAVAAGDLDEATVAGRALARALEPVELVEAVGDVVVPSLAAAAHGAIFLWLLGRTAPRSPLAASLFGTMAREVARASDLRLHWQEEPRPATVVEAVAPALRATPLLGAPGSDFIFPLMDQAERTGTAAAVVGPVIGSTVAPDELRRVRRAILRVAAASMLQDDPDRSPYGWSHCLTIPQAVAGIAGRTRRPADALAVAATHVVGFRAGLGATLLPDEVALDVAPADVLLDDGPDRAAAAVLAGVVDRGELVRTLATHAATHPDAHLAKYTLAGLDAARSDPTQADLHLAAAAHLGAWWRRRGIEDPLAA